MKIPLELKHGRLILKVWVHDSADDRGKNACFCRRHERHHFYFIVIIIIIIIICIMIIILIILMIIPMILTKEAPEDAQCQKRRPQRGHTVHNTYYDEV